MRFLTSILLVVAIAGALALGWIADALNAIAIAAVLGF